MIQLELASPFWEDPATLSAEGEDEDAVARICITALVLAGYDVQVRQGEELVPWEEYDPEQRNA
jgi:hypothetical protein